MTERKGVYMRPEIKSTRKENWFYHEICLCGLNAVYMRFTCGLNAGEMKWHLFLF